MKFKMNREDEKNKKKGCCTKPEVSFTHMMPHCSEVLRPFKH